MAVPVEVHLHPAVLVGPDLLAAGADHQGGLRPPDYGLRGQRQRAEGLAGVHAVEVALVLQLAFHVAGLIAFLGDAVARAHHQVFAVLVVARVVGQLEQVAGAQAARLAPQLHAFEPGLDGFDAGTGEVFAVLALHVLARVVVERVIAMGMAARHAGADFQARAGPLEVIVVERQGAGLDFPGQVPVEEVVALALLVCGWVVGHAGVVAHR
ncbi:hypothetical protein D3C84_509500 [compost metagenome]